jgi:glycosyltransferase involved in cell wall biosynthesis
VQDPPRLSVGLPVYNGERFLRQAIDSVLNGSFQDLELIVSDNCSTDETESIAHAYASRDPRVRYVRNDRNIGPVANFNQAFRLARGDYFKWLAYDDICGPELLARCVAVLDDGPSVALCSARFSEIDASGHRIADQPYRIDLSSTKPHVRLGNLLCTSKGHPILYGVIRSSVLRTTGLLANYHGSDRALIAALALRGRLLEIPEELWESRDHPDRSPRVRATNAGWDPGRNSGPPQHVAIAIQIARILVAAPLPPSERLHCLLAVMRCVAGRSRELLPVVVGELTDAVRSGWHRIRVDATDPSRPR